LLSEEKTGVIYGFFDQGVCLIEVDPKTKNIFKEILAKFDTKPS
jgi:uncharacterized protein (UPF0218 family)